MLFVSSVWFFYDLRFDWLLWGTRKCHERGTCFAKLRACVMTVHVAWYSESWGKGLGVHIHALPALSTLSQSSARQFRLFKHVLKFKGCSFNRLLECSHFVVVPGFVLVILGGKLRDNRLRRYRPAIFVLLFAGLRVALFVCV